MRKHFYRPAVNTWYVEINSKQVLLGKDERFTTPPKVKPKEPPPAIQKKYLAVMQAQAEPEDPKLSFCVAEYLPSRHRPRWVPIRGVSA